MPEHLHEDAVREVIFAFLHKRGIQKPVCPLCKGQEWKVDTVPTKVGSFDVMPLACLSCGRIEFFWMDLIGRGAVSDMKKIEGMQ